MNNLEVMKLADIPTEDQTACAEWADKAGLTPEETAKAYYLACAAKRDPVLFFADIFIERMDGLD